MATDAKFIYEYLKDDFAREMQRYDRLRNRISVVGGALILLGSGITSLLSTYQIDFVAYPARDGIFVFFVACAMTMFAASLIYFAKAAVPEIKTANPADSLQLWESYEKWAKYEENPRVYVKPNVEQMFRENICSQLATAGSFNRKATEARSKLLQLALLCAFYTGLILIAPATCKVLKLYDDTHIGPVQVEVIKLPKVKL